MTSREIKISLSVFASNERAIKVYQKFGFVEEGKRIAQFSTGPLQFTDEVLMAKFL